MLKTRSGLHQAVENFLSRAALKQPTVAGSIVVGPRRLFCSRRPLRDLRTTPHMSDRFDPAVHRSGRATDVGHGLEAPLRDRTDLTRHAPGHLRGSAPAEEETGHLSGADTSRMSSRVSWADRAEFASFLARWGLRSWALITSSARRRTHSTLPAPAPVGRGVLGAVELVPRPVVVSVLLGTGRCSSVRAGSKRRRAGR